MPDLLIVGGGVGGLTLAVTLARYGHNFLLLEQQEQAVETGAGLLLAPNATRILQELGLWDELRKRGHVTSRWSILDQAGSVLREIQMPPDGPPALSIHRADLLSVLGSSLPVGSWQTGLRVDKIESFQEGVRVSLADGATLTGKALVGADGIRSAVRRHVFGEQALRYRGYVGWRGIAPFVPSGYADGVLSESRGPGGRFGIAPVDRSRTYWYASANHKQSWVDHRAERQAGILKHFAHWHKPILDLVASTPNEQILVSRIYDKPPLPSWSKENVTLLGDAAHAMTPNLGQGACLAIEDAWTLGSLIGNRSAAAADIFQEYGASRRARALSIQRQSQAMGWVVQVENPLLVALRDWVVPRVPEILIQAGIRSLFSGSGLHSQRMRSIDGQR